MNRAGIITNDKDFVTAQIHWIVDKIRAPLIVIRVEDTSQKEKDETKPI